VKTGALRSKSGVTESVTENRPPSEGDFAKVRVKGWSKSPPLRKAISGGQDKPNPVQDQIGNEDGPSQSFRVRRISPRRKVSETTLDKWMPSLPGDRIRLMSFQTNNFSVKTS